MTREDTIRILDRICKLYITQAKKLSRNDKAAMVQTWVDTFRADSYDDVDRAVSSYVRKGNAFMPLAGDIVKELTAAPKTNGEKIYTEADKLFRTLVNVADMLANRKPHQSITDLGGIRWGEELQRKIYVHPEVVISETLFTQYDFKQLPPEIQEYVEDIQGLRDIWHELQNSRVMARQRFDRQLPEIKAELARREEQNIALFEELRG